jgi:dTMP kinase
MLALANKSTVTGQLIVIEGPDGAGKSTLQKALCVALQALGIDVLLSKEPTEGPHGRALRLAAKTVRLAPERELELLLLDRRAHVQDLIEPALARGSWVILDRYYFSTIAYQGSAGLDLDELRRVNEVFAPPPDALLLLDLSYEQARQRMEARGDLDDFERESTQRRVREIFQSFAALPYAHLIEAAMGPEAVFKAAWKAISTLPSFPHPA